MAELPSPDTAIVFSTQARQLAAFYEEGLGLGPARHRSDRHIGFQLEHLYLGFDQVDEPVASAGSNTSLWFRVDDIEATFDRLVDLGASVRYGPTEKPFGDVVAAVYDLDGNLVGLSQRRA